MLTYPVFLSHLDHDHPRHHSRIPVFMRFLTAESVRMEECQLKAVDDEEQPLLRLRQSKASAIQNPKVRITVIDVKIQPKITILADISAGTEMMQCEC